MTMIPAIPLATALSLADETLEAGTLARDPLASLALLAEAVREYLAGQRGTWTVLGIWDSDEAVPVGAIAGRHPVHGEAPGDRLRGKLLSDPDFYGFDTSSFYEQGVWAVTVTAPDGDTAQDLAAAEMMATLEHDDEGAIVCGCCGVPLNESDTGLWEDPEAGSPSSDETRYCSESPNHLHVPHADADQA